ncbi:unnamed protein product [Meloidogyne enterolobii]|uniref:Uncharacterized protein n=1 Tax=Meloidogyne enterolobii TaxID=390850 RepID=A0ACB1ALK4_MELEN
MADNLYENASSLDNVVGTQSSPSGSATSIYLTNLVEQQREELRMEREENARLRKRNVELEGIIRSGQAVLGTAFAPKEKKAETPKKLDSPKKVDGAKKVDVAKKDNAPKK